jgi:hypothetical protein
MAFSIQRVHFDHPHDFRHAMTTKPTFPTLTFEIDVFVLAAFLLPVGYALGMDALAMHFAGNPAQWILLYGILIPCLYGLNTLILCDAPPATNSRAYAALFHFLPVLPLLLAVALSYSLLG